MEGLTQAVVVFQEQPIPDPVVAVQVPEAAELAVQVL
jgi:hypothetical protein